MSIEEIKQPELKCEELLKLLPTIRWEMGYSFIFNKIELTIFISTAEDMQVNPESFGEDAEYHQSTVGPGYDIYVHDTITKENRERILFHEIMEIDIIEQGFSTEIAHQTARTEEERIFGPR